MDDSSKRWAVHFNKVLYYRNRLSICENVPNIQGLQQFNGKWYHTGHWPHEKVDFTGKRVGIIGTGSSGIQAIPVIAKEAEQLTVFQRTPQYTIPARNHAYEEDFIKETKKNFEAIKRSMRNSVSGTPFAQNQQSAMEEPDDKRQAVLRKLGHKVALPSQLLIMTC